LSNSLPIFFNQSRLFIPPKWRPYKTEMIIFSLKSNK
jgi:hypothetical protein